VSTLFNRGPDADRPLVCFVSMIPMEKFLDYGGEQLSLYCGVQLGDLIMVTLNNFVEAALAVILLARCE
jgi:Ca2+:H+ antiporter